MRSIRWEWLLIAGVMLVTLGCAGSLYKKAMNQKDASVLREYIQKYGADDDPEMVQRARDAVVELDAVLYAEAEAIDQPESYRVYLATGDISHLHEAKAELKHDAALLRNASAAKGFAALEKVEAEAIFARTTVPTAVLEACKRRLAAIGATLEGSAVNAFIGKCVDQPDGAIENARAFFHYSTGVTSYAHAGYLAWRGGESDGWDSAVPSALRSSGEAWVLAKESRRLRTSEEDPTLIARVVAAESALPEMDEVKERHDALIAPCGPAKGWECALKTPESRESWLTQSGVYVASCLVCAGKEAVNARLPDLHKKIGKDRKAECKSSKKSALKDCKGGEVGELRSECKANFKGGKSGCTSEKRECAQMKRFANQTFGAGASRLTGSCGGGYSNCMAGVKRENKQCTANAAAMEGACKDEVEADGIRCMAVAGSVGMDAEEAAKVALEADRKARSHVCSKEKKSGKSACKLQKKLSSGECSTAKKECKESNRVKNLYNDHTDMYMRTSNCGSDARDCNSSAKEAMKECMANADVQFEECVAGEDE